MRSTLATLFAVVAWAFVLGAPAYPADDWSFINGKYAIEAEDCKLVAGGKPFSKALVDGIAAEVLTREGITSPRETHCKFRSSAKGDSSWTVKADCEEMGAAESYDLAVETKDDGSISVLSEDVFGPDPLVFKPCK